MKISKYFYYLVWFIGAIGLAYFGNFFLDYVDTKTKSTYELTYSMWASVWVPFVMGAYLSLINVVPQRIKVNKPKLIVFILSFLILIYAILPLYIKIPYTNFYLDIIKHKSLYFFGLVSGMTLITGLSEQKNTS